MTKYDHLHLKPHDKTHYKALSPLFLHRLPVSDAITGWARHWEAALLMAADIEAAGAGRMHVVVAA